MKRIMIILIFSLFSLLLNAQAKLALTSSEYKAINNQNALINKLLIELKGCEWYEKYIIDNKNYKSKCGIIYIDYNGMIYIKGSKFVLPEIMDALTIVARHIEKNNLIIYKTEFIDNIIHTDYPKEKNKELLRNYIITNLYYWDNPSMFYVIGSALLTNEFVINYNNYVKKEKNAGREPAISRCEWLMNEFEKVLAIPIKSTLDYDITINELNIFIPPLKF